MLSPPSTELKEAEIRLLDEFLDSIDGAMSLEEHNGFFCALICGPDPVMPKEYLPHVFGGKLFDFSSAAYASKIMGLLLQIWNHIADTLQRDELYFPLMFEDERGKCQGNEWADGFMLGVKLRLESWSGLIKDEENWGLIAPIMALHLEHDDDPERRPAKSINNDEREEIITEMIACNLDIYRYFAPKRSRGAEHQIQRQHPKIGRNDLCYCGSGMAYNLFSAHLGHDIAPQIQSAFLRGVGTYRYF
jgi:uncharacterized protein